MRIPRIYYAKVIYNWDIGRKTKSGRYIPARPYSPLLGIIGFIKSVKTRFIVACNVFIGKYDALDWQEDLE